MTKLFTVPLVMLAAVVSSAQGPKPEREESRQVLALENAWNQAEVRADISGLNLLLGDEFVYTDIDGSLKNRARWLADVQKRLFSMSSSATRTRSYMSTPTPRLLQGSTANEFS